MPEPTQAERYLVTQIKAGNAGAWEEFVQRYHGRLLAFARGRSGGGDEGEDLVQDTMLSFLQSLAKFDDNASLETYLFTILRRKLIDRYRGRHLRPCSLDGLAGEDDRPMDVAGNSPSASVYVRQQEATHQLHAALVEAIRQVVARLREKESLRDLKLMEACFYAQMRNKDVATMLNMAEGQVALVKHRTLAAVKAAVEQAGTPSEVVIDEDLLSRVWEEQRLTCPKRSTLGRWVLGTLEPEWTSYAEFHVSALGCRFCHASVADLRENSQDSPQSRQVRDRLMQSTIGFLKSV